MAGGILAAGTAAGVLDTAVVARVGKSIGRIQAQNSKIKYDAIKNVGKEMGIDVEKELKKY